MPDMDVSGLPGRSNRHWRNLITGECRASALPGGELDWVEDTHGRCVEIFTR